jgi:hypothetical protein
MLLDNESKNIAFKAMIARSSEPFADNSKHYPSMESIHIIYGGTSKRNDMARWLMVLLYSKYVTPYIVSDPNDRTLHDFFFNLAITLTWNRPSVQAYRSVQDELSSVKKKLASLTAEDSAVNTV